MSVRAFLHAAVWVGLAAGANGAELSSREKQIQSYVVAHTEEAIELLARVVNINSGTMNTAGVRAVGEIFREELDALGFETRWIDFPSNVHRAGHLVAERSGSQGRRLLLIGHLDTVFERESSFQKFERDGMRATGPGIGDMKGGDVVLLYALKALHEAGALENTAIQVILTGDEETPGLPISLVRRDLLEAARQSDVALGFEDSVGAHKATLARRGSSTWTLQVRAKGGHSSQIFSDELGSGAIFEASRILSTFFQEIRGERYLTFNPGVILGGTEVGYDHESSGGTAFGKANVTPRLVTIHGGLRFISEEQKERAREKMRAVVDQSLPHASAEITFEDDYPAMSPTDGNQRLFELFDEASQDLGLGVITPLDPGARGAADISFVAPIVDALSGLGPLGYDAHAEGESLDLDSLPVATARAAVFIYRLTR